MNEDPVLHLPGPIGDRLGGADVVAWVEIDLAPDGRFAAGFLVLVARPGASDEPGPAGRELPAVGLVRLHPGEGGTWALERTDLAPSESLVHEELDGLVLLWRTPGGDEIARSTMAGLGPLVEFVDRVDRFRASGARPAGPAPLSSPCPTCTRPKVGGRCPTCRSRRELLVRLLAILRPRAPAIATSILLLTAASGLALVPPYLVKILVDSVLRPGTPVVHLVGVVVLMGIVMASSQLVGFLRQVLDVHTRGHLAHRLRSDAFEALGRLSWREVNDITPGMLSQTVMGDAGAIVGLVLDQSFAGLTHLLGAGGALAILAWIHPLLCVLIVGPALPLALVLDRLSRGGIILSTRAWEEAARLGDRVYQFLAGFRVVKTFGAERAQLEAFRETSERQRYWEYRSTWYLGRFGPVIALGGGIGSLLIWGVGGSFVLAGDLEVGSLVAAISYLGLVHSHGNGLLRLVAALPPALVSVDRYFELLDAPAAVGQPARPVVPDRIRGAIRLEGVAFSYRPGREVLSDLDLVIEPGEMVGLVGPSGAGKTTLVNLIARFHDPDRGRILLDGVELHRIDLPTLRRSLAVVLQTPFLFEGTIKENLLLGRPDASLRQICEAADRAQAHDFVMALPDGYDTHLGSQDANLSLGEQQRLTIARAILADPRILILDEATSSVDTQTEMRIQEALAQLVAGRTTLAIAHRLSTLALADRLIVIEAGRIVQAGPHDELVGRPGLYRDLVSAQLEMTRLRVTRGGEVAGGVR